MVRLVMYVVVGVSVLSALPHYVSRYQQSLEETRRTEANAAVESARRAQARIEDEANNRSYKASYASGRALRIAPDVQGHFTADFEINGRPVEGLVDTGATFVAMNLSTARRLGLNPRSDAFDSAVSTANGRTSAARILLDTVEIGTIRVRDVEAFILDDSSLSTTLIGMSFMSKLGAYSVENGELVMVEKR